MAGAMGAFTVSPPHIRLARAFDNASAKPETPPSPAQQVRRAAINSPEYKEPPKDRSRLASGWR
jgi:hypothetical protein